MFAYSHDGTSFRAVDPDHVAAADEVLFQTYATVEQLTAAFPGYAAARLPSVAQQAASCLQNGTIHLACSSDPALDGTYAATLAVQSQIAAIAAGIGVGLGLPQGATTIPWQDTAGTDHAFTQPQFLEFGAVVRDYAFALIRCTQGALTTLPSPALAIA